ncbi:ATP-binding cassette domain-containing protein [Elioraea sp.]|uniref:ATP-binding cassette domain-containing protein n=1 Tax=Elioraea sp. TaxID=2185103 RepID=UPI0025C194AC|nr:ATP-binding cassette domain-containing protein [Elioraea sp.]
MDTGTPVLSFIEARLAIEPAGGLTAPVTVTLMPGSLVLADMRGPRRRRAFADAAVGLNRAAEGRVLFQGRDWAEVASEHAGAMRGRIGRLFAAGAWIPDLPVADNILLAPLYHTGRSRRALRDEAARLASTFGLPGLPTALADDMSAADLHRAGLARAFLNEPSLVILEEPTAEGGEDLLRILMAAIRAVRDRGGAVLWLTQGNAVALDRSVPVTERLRLMHGMLLPIGVRAP